MFEILIFAACFTRNIPTVVDLQRNRTAPFSYKKAQVHFSRIDWHNLELLNSFMPDIKRTTKIF